MNRIISRSFLSVFTLCLMLAVYGCQDERPESKTVQNKAPQAAAEPAPRMAPAVDQGAPVPAGQALEVLRFGPEGRVKKLSQVVVMFNQPMVALGDFAQVPEGALKVELLPGGELSEQANKGSAITAEIKSSGSQLAGTTRWLNQYTLSFHPEKPLSGSARVKAVLNHEALAALSGARMTQAREILIELPPLELVDSSLLNSVPLNEDEALRPVWRVLFNQAPDLESLKSLVYFSWGGDDAAKKEPAEVIKVDDRRFDIRPVEKMPRDTPYSLALEGGLKSLAGPELAGPLTLASERTFGAFTAEIESMSDDGAYHPGYGFSLYFSNPVRLSEIVPLLSIDGGYDLASLKKRYVREKSDSPEAADKPEAVEETVEAGEEEPTRMLYLGGGFKADFTYTLTLNGAAKDIFGQSLSGEKTFTAATGQYDTELELDENYGLLESSSPARLALRATNISEARVEGYALTAEEAAAFMAGSSYSHTYFSGLNEAEQFLERKSPFLQTIKIPGAAKNGPVIVPVDLEELFGDERLGHLLFVRIKYKAPDGRGEPRDRQTYALVQISDIGLGLKVGASSSLAWVTRLDKGEGRPEADLTLLDRNGKALWSGKSGEHGLAELPGLETLADKYKYNERQFFLAARAEGQMSIWSLGWDDGLESWRWNINTADPVRGRSSENWLLSALPLYKPGEKVRLKIIAREREGDGLAAPDAEKLEISIHDALGKLVSKETAALSSFGTAACEVQTTEDQATGYWEVRAGRPGESPAYVGGFLVTSYRAPAFEIKVDGAPESAVSGDEVSFSATGNYHFGAPVSGQPVKYNATYSPHWWRLPGAFSDYSIQNDFNEADEYDDSGYGYTEPSVTIMSESGVLDKNGRVQIKINLKPEPDKQPRPRFCRTSITVTDVDQRQVSTSAGFMVHPASIYAGILSENYVVEAGQPFNVKLIAANLDGSLVEGRKIKTTVFKRQWQNVRRKSAGSVYEYVSRMTDEKISEQEITSGALPEALELSLDKAGYYWVLAEVRDDQGRLNQAAVDLYVAGGGPVGWRMNNDDRLALVPDKKEYKAGEVARIMVQSPFESGQGLLTVERSGVRDYRIFNIENQTPVLTVPVKEEDAPNVFVSVLLTRGRISEKLDERGLDLGKPAVRLGYIELKVPSEKDLLKVEVAPDLKETGPGGEIEVALAVKDDQGNSYGDAEVALIVADAAVLQLGGERGYFPETLFHRDYPLSVRTVDNLVSLIGRRNWGLKGANPGGGGALMGSPAMQTDGVRRQFSTLAYFDPHVSLDAEGQAKVKVKMPENLTTFKIYAVATGAGRKTGTGQSAVLVTRDLLARSALPNYAGVGDEFQAAMVISNRGRKQGSATVSLGGENFTLLEDSSEKQSDMAPGESREVRFKVKALKEGQAKFLFMVDLDGDRDSVEFVIPVTPPNPLTTQAFYEKLEAGQWKTDLAVTEGLDKERGGLELQVSPSLIGTFKEPFDWLAAYPHGCVEQSVSKGFGNLYWLALKDRLPSSSDQEKKARGYVDSLLEKLGSWEYSGGFNYWPGSRQWNGRGVYLTAYVLDFHLSAREAGFKLPDPEIIKRMAGFLKNTLNRDYADWPKWYSQEAIRETRSYALAMLARAGENVAAYTEVMYGERNEASLFELINLLRTVNFQNNQGKPGQVKELIGLMNKFLSISAGEVQVLEPQVGTPEIWSSSIRTSAMALRAFCEAAPKNDLIAPLVRGLISASRAGHFGTTQNNSAVLGALAAYMMVMEPDGKLNLQIKAFLGDSELTAAAFTSYTAAPVEAGARLADIPAETSVLIYDVSGEGQAWALLRMKTAPAEPDLSASSSGGYIVSRSFSVLQPEPGIDGVNVFKRGDLVRVNVTMMVPVPRHSTVLVDRVPAGFEPINFNLADADSSLAALLSQTGEDENDYENYGRQNFWYNHQEIWPDRVAVYADHLSAGVYTFSYLARAVTSGTYLTPGPRAEEMYAPETFGQGAGHKITVE